MPTWVSTILISGVFVALGGLEQMGVPGFQIVSSPCLPALIPHPDFLSS
jgi:hypothetical protein